MIGKIILHYRILEKLGEGGMGVVYLAEDTKLERKVAIKFLPHHIAASKEDRQRFETEAKAAAALNHPNIATIHTIDEHDDDVFIVMEYIEGQDLQKIVGAKHSLQSISSEQDEVARNASPLHDHLPVDQIINIASQIAAGLQAAHEKGIVHRDIKSPNIMITEKGQVKITDFGLAKFPGNSETTAAGKTLGTIAYMSPEQVRGEDVDHRTDIWALGVVLFELLTGQLPFTGEYEQALMYSIVNETPLPLNDFRRDVPETLEKIVAKMLARDCAGRYQSAGEIIADLEGLSQPVRTSQTGTEKSGAEGPSVAVLPFSDLSPGHDQEYFCDGIAEEIIDALGKMPDWRVVARTSTFVFKGKQADVREIGKQLNVSHVLEGSLRQSGKRLRIKVTLVKVDDGFQLWSEKYDRELADIFEIQEDIARSIVSTLKVRLISEKDAPLVKRHTDNLDAYTLYLKGRHAWNKRTETGLQDSLVYFEKAIESDPHFPLAYVGLADTYNILGNYSYLQPSEAYPRARFAAQKALEIDNNLAEAYPSLAMVKLAYEWDWPGAAQAFEQALALNPNYAIARHWYAINYLVPMAKFKEALEQIRLAETLDPLSHIIKATEGLVHYFAGEYDAAVKRLQSVLQLQADLAVLHQFLGWALGQKGMFTEAIASLKKAIELTNQDVIMEADLGYTYALAGKDSETREVLGRLQAHLQKQPNAYLSYPIATIYAALGDAENALNYLERAVVEKSFRLIYLKVDPRWNEIQKQSQFANVLKKISFDIFS